MSILKVEGLVKVYGRRRVVDGVDFEVDRGEIVEQVVRAIREAKRLSRHRNPSEIRASCSPAARISGNMRRHR